MSTRRFVAVAMGSVLVAMASLALGATNLNSSRSNIYRLVYPPAVTPAQAAALAVSDEGAGGQKPVKGSAK